MTDAQPDFTRHLEPGERCLLATDADITPDGRFEPCWLVVTDRRLMSFVAGDGLPPLCEGLPLGDVDSVQAVHLVGRGVLQARVGRRRANLVGYSNGHIEKFAKVARELTEARRADREPAFDLKTDLQTTCPLCGRLLPEPGGFCPSCLKKRHVAARLWRYMRPYLHLAVLIVALMLIASALSLAPPAVTKLVVDGTLVPTLASSGALAGALAQMREAIGTPGLLAVLVAVLVACFLLSTVASIFQGRLSARLTNDLMHEVRCDFYQALQGLALRRYDRAQTGSLISRLTGDTRMLNFFFMDVGLNLLPMSIQFVGICVMLFVLSWKLAFLVLVPAPLVAGLTVWAYRRLHGLYHRLMQRSARLFARATDSITGIRVVKAFAREPQEIVHFGRSSQELAQVGTYSQSIYATVFPIIGIVTMSGTFLVWYFGGLQVIGGSMTLGSLMAYLAYLGMFYGPLRTFTHFSDMINRGFAAAQRLFEIMDADQEVYEAAGARSLPAVQGAFRFENVHFAYVPDKPVLQGVDAEVKAGEMIGLVGRSGVGKTTMINLICRFYDVDEGRILLDGVNLRDLKLRDLRRYIGIVPQEPFLFNVSVAENIAFARPEATREEIIRAAIAGNCHGFIMRLPDGYDTPCGERGARLSAGERQRIAIARAILHDPRVLILDEATSSVDVETEQLIQEALARLVKGRTTFAIAHRLATLRNADRLLVLENGRVAEFGTHDQLMQSGGIYQRLVDLQSRISSIRVVGG